MHALRGQELARESNVLADVRRIRLEHDPIGGNTPRDRALRENLGLASVPHRLGPLPEIARKYDQRRPPLLVEIRAVFGDSQIVTAEADDAIGVPERLIQMVIV